MEKLEREHQGEQTEGLQTHLKYEHNATATPRMNEGARTHLVWDPSVQGLVPIIDPEQMNLTNNNHHHHNNNYSGGNHGNGGKKHYKKHHHRNHHHHHRNHHHHHNNNNNHNNNHSNNNNNNSNHNSHNGGGNNHNHSHSHHHHNHHKGHTSGRLVSPFPRRYTSSHIPRYRRKYEMNEIRKIRQNNSMINSADDNGVKI